MSCIENALPVEVAESVRALFVNAEYAHIDQIRDRKYADEFRTESEFLPKIPERYTARFWRSNALSESREIEALYAEHIAPLIGASGNVRLLAYKMTEGDHFRVHIDEYASTLGFIYYLSKGWKWDWGGLLVAMDGELPVPTLPKFNQLVVLNNSARIPHFVTQVAPFALEPRYTLVGLIGP